MGGVGGCTHRRATPPSRRPRHPTPTPHPTHTPGRRLLGCQRYGEWLGGMRGSTGTASGRPPSGRWEQPAAAGKSAAVCPLQQPHPPEQGLRVAGINVPLLAALQRCGCNERESGGGSAGDKAAAEQRRSTEPRPPANPPPLACSSATPWSSSCSPDSCLNRCITRLRMPPCSSRRGTLLVGQRAAAVSRAAASGVGGVAASGSESARSAAWLGPT